MRLLHTSEPRFAEFYDERVPDYLVLSHRWTRQEATFQDDLSYLRNPPLGESASHGGHEKIVSFRAMLRRTPAYCCDWVWVDTCCIDKKSSAELSEAINSMYRWYKAARACVVYLHDLPGADGSSPDERREAFRRSEWFTRGWTLQELLAPTAVIFFDRDWAYYGDRSSLAAEISSITGIAKAFLKKGPGQLLPQQASVAMRMSWMAARRTTRVEDLAYAMLGLFDINLPPLYGEGAKAFLRLQLEILKKSDDESLFAWTAAQPHSWGMLARSPAAFARSGHIVQRPMGAAERRPYDMTNKGLRIHGRDHALSKEEFKALGHVFSELRGGGTHTLLLGCFDGEGANLTFQSTPPAVAASHSYAIRLIEQGNHWARLVGPALHKIGLPASHKSAGRKAEEPPPLREYLIVQPDL